MGVLPPFLGEQTYSAILARTLARLEDWDTTQGGFVYDLIAAWSMESTNLAIWLQQAVEAVFAQTAQSTYLDAIAAMYGLTRHEAVAATTTLQVAGANGTVVPAGARFSSATSVGSTVAAQEFTTDVAVTIGPTLVADVPATATIPGAAGNVASGSVQLIVGDAGGAPLTGVSAVVNQVAGTGGTDPEPDGDPPPDATDLRKRILFRMAHPRSSGTEDDYISWTLDVTGTGSADVALLEDESGNQDVEGTLSVYVGDADGRPASQALLDQVQLAVAPPYTFTLEAEGLAIVNGNGVSSVDRGDDSGTTMLLSYSASGPAELARTDLATILPRRGIWQARPRVAVTNSAAATAALRFGVYNDTIANWCPVSQTNPALAYRDVAAAQMTANFANFTQDFYWNGTDTVRFRAIRQATDTTAIVALDDVTFRSASARTDRALAQAPAFARVAFKAMQTVEIDVDAAIRTALGADRESVKTSIEVAIDDYISGLATSQGDRTVRYAEIARIVKATAGVTTYEALLLNGVLADIPVARFHIPVLVTINVNTWDEYDPIAIRWDDQDALMLTWPNINRILEE